MPGIVGFIKGNISGELASKSLSKMQELITHKSFYTKDEQFCDDSICATRSHVNILQKSPQPMRDSGILVWLDGEFYNRDEVARKHQISATSDPELISKLYRKCGNLKFLKEIDGFFSAVLYDTTKEILNLFTDRYGLRHIYWTLNKGMLAWASEVKAFLALPGFNPKIDKRAVREFFEIGYLLEDRTWFEGVELLSSASILSYHIKEGRYRKERYWWWSDIKESNAINERDAVDETQRLFSDAVTRRVDREHKIGIHLSGGLDSRAILAAVPDLGYAPHLITFGRKGSGDIKIAAMAAGVKKTQHHILEINKDNWLSERINGVWWTDGHKTLEHMHSIEFINEIPQYFDINLNGYAADLLIRGSFMKTRAVLDRPITKEIAIKNMNCSEDLLDNIQQYQNLGKVDYYFIQNHVRRFTFSGTKFWLTRLEHRKPFMDYKLIDFLYSLPDAMRYDGNLYIKMLSRHYPEFFKTIPWQRTGVAITAPKPIEVMVRAKNKFLELYYEKVLKVANPIEYTNYPKWIRQEPAVLFFKDMLLSKDALYPNYIDKSKVMNKLDEHLSGRCNYTKDLCLALTFEIWLKQVFDKTYRPDAHA